MARVTLALLLALYCGSAMADPISLIALMLHAGGFKLAALAFTLMGGVRSLLGAADMRRKQFRAAARQRAEYNASLQDRNVTVLSNDSPWQVVIGSPAPVGGSLLAILTSGDTDQFKHLVIAFAAHPSHAIDEVYIEGDAVGSLDGSGWATAGVFYEAGTDTTITDYVLFTSGSATLTRVPLVILDAYSRTGDADMGFVYTNYTVSTANTVTVTIAALTGIWVWVTYSYSTAVSRVNVQKHLSPGGVDTANAFLIAAVPSKWTSAAKLSGYTYIVLTLDLRMPRFQGGPPNVTVKMRGKLLYDYRTATTVYSTNNALAAADFLRSDYGFAATAGQMDNANWYAAANACDAQGFECNGVFDTDGGRDSTLQALEDSMAGYTHWSGGVWRATVGAWTTPVMSLTDADLAGPIEVMQTAFSRPSRYNSVRGNYSAGNGLGVVSDMTPYVVGSYVTADGTNQWVDIGFQFTSTNTQCGKLAAIAVEKSRAGLTINYPAHLRAWKLQPGDRVTVTNAELGFDAKSFRVQDWAHSNTSPLALTMTEDVASNYTGTFSNNDPLAATSNLANPWANPAAPVGLSVASGTTHLLRGRDGGITTRAWVSWTVPTVRAVLQGGYTQVQWRDATVVENWVNTDIPADTSSQYLVSVPDGINIIVRVRFVTGVGAQGAWANIAHKVIGKTAPPANITTVDFAVEQFGVRLTWTDVLDLDLYGFEIRVGGSSWLTSTLVAQVTGTLEYLWKIQAAGSQTIRMRAIDTTGNYSAAETTRVVTIAAPSAPTVLVTVAGVNETLSWSIPTSGFAVDRYEIRVGASYAAGVFVDTAKATSYSRRVDYVGAKSYWVAAIDAAGNTGTAGNVATNIAAPGVVAGLRVDVVDNNALIYWNAPSTGSLPVDRYEARKGVSWAAGTIIGSNGNSTFTTVFEQVGGTYTYWISAVDSAGNYGAAVSVVANINQPPDYVLRADVNSPLCGNHNYWSATDKTANMTVDRASGLVTHTAAALWGSARADVGQAGGRWYWEVRATSIADTHVFVGVGRSTASVASAAYPGIDVNGWGYYAATGSKYNSAAPTAYGAAWVTGDVIGVLLDMTLAANSFVQFFKNGVSQGQIVIGAGTWFPMVGEYNIADQLTANFGATAFVYPMPANCNGSTNVLLQGGQQFLPVLTTESWTSHYSVNSYANPQAQITAGFPIYINPSQTTAVYTEDLDYGAVLSTSSIQVTLNSTVLSGSVTATCQIKVKLNLGNSWTSLAAGSAALATNFRYVQIVWSFTATAGANLLRVDAMNIKLNIKLRNDSGIGTAAVAGTPVSFGYAFLSCDTPIVQPTGSGAPRIAVVTFSGGPNPTSFSVQIFNLAGTDVGGSFSWSVRGY